jgi:hypothetical protein
LCPIIPTQCRCSIISDVQMEVDKQPIHIMCWFITAATNYTKIYIRTYFQLFTINHATISRFQNSLLHYMFRPIRPSSGALKRKNTEPSNVISLPETTPEILTAVVMERSTFWDITPCSPLKANRRFIRTCRRARPLLAACFTLLSCMTYSSILSLKATYLSETSVDFSTDYTALYPRRLSSSAQT